MFSSTRSCRSVNCLASTARATYSSASGSSSASGLEQAAPPHSPTMTESAVRRRRSAVGKEEDRSFSW